MLSLAKGRSLYKTFDGSCYKAAVLLLGRIAVLRRLRSVCRSYVTIVSPAKTTELIEMPFGMWTQVGQRNHVLDGGLQIPAREVAI